MRQRKVLLGSMLALSLVLVGASAGGAAPDTETGDAKPVCADIAQFRYTYEPPSQPKGAGNFHSKMRLAAPSCRGMTYTVSVTDPNVAAPKRAVVASQAVRGDGSTILTFDDLLITGNPELCVSVTSSAGARVFDRIPDEEGGCIPPGIDIVDYWWFP